MLHYFYYEKEILTSDLLGKRALPVILLNIVGQKNWILRGEKIMSIKKLFTLLAVAVISFTIFLPQLAQAYTEVGDKNNASLTIHKFERPGAIDEDKTGTGDAGQTVPEGAKALQGVVFEITQTHSFDPVTNKWTEKAGTAIERTTDAKGEILETGLELGRYTVQEIDGPEHVVLNKEIFSVDIPMTSADGTRLNYNVHIYPKNETIKGSVELTKTGENKEALEGAEFALYKGTPNTGEKIGGTYTTDADGKFVVGGLDFGDHYFVETKAPEGHTLNNAPIEFKVTETGSVDADGNVQGAVVETSKVNYIIPEITKDANGKQDEAVNRDEEIKYNLTLTLPADITKYEEFVVTDILDERLEFIKDGTITGGWSVEGIDASLLTFDDGGQKLTWTINDFTKLHDVKTFKITFTAKIKADAELGENETGIENVGQLDFDNGFGSHTKPKDDEEVPPITPPVTPPVTVKPTDGGMEVIKVDAANNDIKLEGAVFDLQDENGKDVVIPAGSVIKVNGAAVTSLKDLKTGEDGTFVITGLPTGNYKLVETKAPTYKDAEGKLHSYRLLVGPVDVEIKDDQTNNTEVIVENSKSGWELPTTGGMGTILFTVVGLALMAMAAFFLTRRKKEVEA